MGSIFKNLLLFFIFIPLFQIPDCVGQSPDSTLSDACGVKKGRLTGVLIAEGSLYAASVTGLYYAWYRDYPQSAFHLFSDGGEWMQMDKCGHVITTWYIGRIGYTSYRWAGVKENQAAWFGGLLGFAYMLNIEILDGFSSEWGFSLGDLAANTLGSAIFVGQQLLWRQQKFSLKYSFHQTQYAQYRPDLLGKNLIQQMIKDYNGHSYWISGNISSFLPSESKFPKWLNIAIGYGAEGMTGASENSISQNGQPIPEFPRYRKFFLSIDIDLTRIPTRSAALKTLFSVLSFIKIPAPALEYNTLGQFKVHGLYY
ncbi:MAG: DUF2279 domain-containing protein [Bacteroidetes bacterium]|nr:DUF2279 domain-containing protein [Bacteroidota bacterium]